MTLSYGPFPVYMIFWVWFLLFFVVSSVIYFYLVIFTSMSEVIFFFLIYLFFWIGNAYWKMHNIQMYV